MLYTLLCYTLYLRSLYCSSTYSPHKRFSLLLILSGNSRLRSYCTSCFQEILKEDNQRVRTQLSLASRNHQLHPPDHRSIINKTPASKSRLSRQKFTQAPSTLTLTSKEPFHVKPHHTPHTTYLSSTNMLNSQLTYPCASYKSMC